MKILQKVKVLENLANANQGAGTVAVQPTYIPPPPPMVLVLGGDLCKMIDPLEHPTCESHTSDKLMKINLVGGENQSLTWGMQQIVHQMTVHLETLRYRVRENERSIIEIERMHAQEYVELNNLITSNPGRTTQPEHTQPEHATNRIREDKDSHALSLIHSLVTFAGLGSVTQQQVVILKGSTTSDGNRIPAAKLPDKSMVDAVSGVDVQGYPKVPEEIEGKEGVDIYTSLTNLWALVTHLGLRIKNYDNDQT